MRFTEKPENVTCYEEDQVCNYIACDVTQQRMDGSMCSKELCDNPVCGKKTCQLMYSSETYDDVNQFESCPV